MSVLNPIAPAPVSVQPARVTSAAASANVRRSRHMPALDGIRGLAVLLVVFHHTLGSQLPTTGSDPSSLRVVDNLIHWFATGGWCGVDLFFVLSGFLITGILYDAKTSENPLRNFYARRGLRILPLQLGVLFLVFVILARFSPGSALVSAGSGPWLWISMANIPMAIGGKWAYGTFVHFWSLAVEEQFYLVWPLVVLTVPRKPLIGICLGLIVGALALRIGLMTRGVSLISLYVSTPTRMDGLAVGALLALLARGPKGLEACRGPIIWTGIIAAVALAVLVLLRHGLRKEDPAQAYVGYTVLALFFGSLVGIAATSSSQSARLLWNRPLLMFFGKYSYGIYVFDSLVLTEMSQWAYGLPIRVHSYLLHAIIRLVVSLTITTTIAWLSWNFFERHFLKLKRYFH